jgi:hypothetical protein
VCSRQFTQTTSISLSATEAEGMEEDKGRKKQQNKIRSAKNVKKKEMMEEKIKARNISRKT